MRMMKNNNNETIVVIGIDHGYGNMKTATRCFPSGVARYDKEPWLLVISGYTGWKTSGGCFHVSITMINPDHHNCFIIVIFHHSHNHTSFFLNVYFWLSPKFGKNLYLYQLKRWYIKRAVSVKKAKFYVLWQLSLLFLLLR